MRIEQRLEALERAAGGPDPVVLRVGYSALEEPLPPAEQCRFTVIGGSGVERPECIPEGHVYERRNTTDWWIPPPPS